MRQPNGYSTPAPRSSAAKQWFEQLAQNKNRRTRRGSGEAAAPRLEKFQGKLCFQGKHKLLKTLEW